MLFLMFLRSGLSFYVIKIQNDVAKIVGFENKYKKCEQIVTNWHVS
jgi:hypothetical protein